MFRQKDHCQKVDVWVWVSDHLENEFLFHFMYANQKSVFYLHIFEDFCFVFFLHLTIS